MYALQTSCTSVLFSREPLHARVLASKAGPLLGTAAGVSVLQVCRWAGVSTTARSPVSLGASNMLQACMRPTAELCLGVPACELCTARGWVAISAGMSHRSM